MTYVLSGKGVRSQSYVKAARAEDVGATLRVLSGLPLEADTGGHVLSQVIDAP
ncbi:MAG: hypothetical protein H7Z43_00745 [Clostridia bacterium]|nr:hypothetical protein [Deltaproteobacteria bacterium]